jgi:hypothetical protein
MTLRAPDVNPCGGEAEIDYLGFTDLPERVAAVYAPESAHAPGPISFTLR